MWRIHKVPLSVKAANLPRFFPPWTVTREQWADMMMPSINLDLFSSSSEEDSKDSAERSELSITLFCDSDEASTRVYSDQVLSDGDFPEESVPKDKIQVVRRFASPPGGQIMGAAQDNRAY